MNEEIYNEAAEQNLLPKYPHNEVVRYIFRAQHNKILQLGDKILNLGCGAGRHVAFLIENGFEAYGIDINEASIFEAKKRLGQNEASNIFQVASCADIPYENNYFNCIICHGSVLCFLNSEELKQATYEIYRILKPNGRAYIDVRSVKDCRYKLGDNKFTLVDTQLDCNEHKMHYFTKEELKKLFYNFSECIVEDYMVTRENGKYADYEHLVYLTK